MKERKLQAVKLKFTYKKHFGAVTTQIDPDKSDYIEIRIILMVQHLKEGSFEKDSIVNCDEIWCKLCKCDHYRKYGDDLLQIHVDTDWFVIPLYEEDFSNIVMETGTMRLPSNVTYINGSREIIIEGKNSLIVSPHTVFSTRQDGWRCSQIDRLKIWEGFCIGLLDKFLQRNT